MTVKKENRKPYLFLTKQRAHDLIKRDLCLCICEDSSTKVIKMYKPTIYRRSKKCKWVINMKKIPSTPVTVKITMMYGFHLSDH